MRVLIVITTGRPVFRKTLDMIGDNIIEYGHTGSCSVGVVVNYDTSMNGMGSSEFTYGGHDAYQEVIMVGPSDAIKTRDIWIRRGVKSSSVSSLFPTSGYGNRRNLIFLTAINKGYDAVLFWDDDEYPVACLQGKAGNTWVSTDILGSHSFSRYPQADVTSGFRTGHALPLASNLQSVLSVETLSILGQALMMGTEFIEPKFILDPRSSFLTPQQVPASREVLETNGGKWVAAGNLSVKISSVVSRVVPPFYIPIGGRGEDTIFSIKLLSANVQRVPCGIFHDCFLEYTEILDGQYPDIFDDPNTGVRHLSRFADALKGWISYSPIMHRLLSPESYEHKLGEMRELLRIFDDQISIEYPKLMSVLGIELSSILDMSMKQVDREYAQIIEAYDAWSDILLLANT